MIKTLLYDTTYAIIYSHLFTYLLLVDFWSVCVLVMVCLVLAIHIQANQNSSNKNNEELFSKKFVLAKSITLIICVVLMNIFRYTGQYNYFVHIITLISIIINIFEASICDLLLKQYYNAISGILLIYVLPYSLTVDIYAEMNNKIITTGMFAFPLS